MTPGSVPLMVLRHGAQMPQLGLGTWPMSNKEAERAIVTAAQAGYRLVKPGTQVMRVVRPLATAR
jgi:2,5-diketo-D-gluconate reductase A